MFEEIDRQAGGLDICVNNAGMAKDDSLLNGSPDAWREMYEVYGLLLYSVVLI